VNFFYRHSRIKEYLKDGRALRIETVVNSPTDLGVLRRLEHLPELISKARAANDQLLHAQRVGQGCVLASPAFERVALSSLNAEGSRAPALRFGDPRVMTLVGAMSIAIHAATGFTNRSLRAQVAGLLGTDQYSTNQMGYDLGRLRLNGLIHRLEGTNTYLLFPEGDRVAIFYTRLQEQVLRPLLAADRPPAPAEHNAPSTGTSRATSTMLVSERQPKKPKINVRVQRTKLWLARQPARLSLMRWVARGRRAWREEPRPRRWFRRRRG
jgi:hypothetical protein